MIRILSDLAKIIKFSFGHPLNTTLISKWHTLKRAVTWLALSRLHRDPVIIPYVENTQLILQKGVSAREPYFHMLNEPREMSFLLHIADNKSIFVDVGANVGAYTLLACIAGSDCIALEPASSTFKLLTNNIRLNHYEDRTTLLRMAAGARQGRCQMASSAGPTNRVTESSSEDDAIQMTTLDELITKRDKSYIVKIDVEGYEEEVLLGAQTCFSQYDVIAVIIESAGNEKNYGKRTSKVADILKAHGYVQCSYDPHTRMVTQVARQTSENVIYLKDIKHIQKKAISKKRFQVGKLLI